MKAKLKQGKGLLLVQDGHIWKNIENRDGWMINFYEKGILINFRVIGNHLLIKTEKGMIDIVFTGEIPIVTLESYEKDELVLMCLNPS